jgi:hypothetical protein
MSIRKGKEWFSRLKELDEEREVLIKKIEEWRASCALDAAKPEEIDPLFCSREEPCAQTYTLESVDEFSKNAVKEKLDKEIDTLFCSREKECEVVPWEIKGSKVLPGEPLVLAKDTYYPWLVDRPKTEAYVENKISHCARIKKYLSEQWQQVKTSFQT